MTNQAFGNKIGLAKSWNDYISELDPTSIASIMASNDLIRRLHQSGPSILQSLSGSKILLVPIRIGVFKRDWHYIIDPSQTQIEAVFQAWKNRDEN